MPKCLAVKKIYMFRCGTSCCPLCYPHVTSPKKKEKRSPCWTTDKRERERRASKKKKETNLYRNMLWKNIITILFLQLMVAVVVNADLGSGERRSVVL